MRFKPEFRPVTPVSAKPLGVCFCLFSVIEIRAPLLALSFGPSARSSSLLCPLLTSARPSSRLPTGFAFWRSSRSPRVMHTHFHAYTCRIYDHDFRTGSDFEGSCLLIRHDRLYALPVRQVSVLRSASFRLRLATDALAVRLTVPPVGPVEDFHLPVRAPCRAHKKNGRPWSAVRLLDGQLSLTRKFLSQKLEHGLRHHVGLGQHRCP